MSELRRILLRPRIQQSLDKGEEPRLKEEDWKLILEVLHSPSAAEEIIELNGIIDDLQDKISYLSSEISALEEDVATLESRLEEKEALAKELQEKPKKR